MDEAQRVAGLVQQPPAATLAWLVDDLDASGVVEVRAMPGGSTAAMHRVTLVDRDGDERDVVLCRYVRPEILAESPDVVSVEARVLQLAERLPVPTPALLVLDVTGDRADVPALAMTLLEGGPVWETRWGLKWVSQAVDAMIALHDVDVSQSGLPAHHVRPDPLRPSTMDAGSGVVGASRRVVSSSDRRCRICSSRFQPGQRAVGPKPAHRSRRLAVGMCRAAFDRSRSLSPQPVPIQSDDGR